MRAATVSTLNQLPPHRRLRVVIRTACAYATTLDGANLKPTRACSRLCVQRRPSRRPALSRCASRLLQLSRWRSGPAPSLAVRRQQVSAAPSVRAERMLWASDSIRHVPSSLTSRGPASSNGFMGGLVPRALTPLQQRHGRDKRRERNPEEPKVPRVPDRVWSLFPVANAGCQFVWRFGKSGSLQRPPCLSPRR